MAETKASVPLTVVSSMITVLASSARTATPATFDFESGDPAPRGVVLVIDVTVVPGSAPSTVVTIKGYDPLSGKAYTILASAAITAVGTTILKVYPGLTASANAVATDVLPPHWQVTSVHGNANSMTYSVGGLLIP